MRFVWAVVAFVLATVLIGAGIAQRTIFMGPSSEQARVQIDEAAPFVMVEGDALRSRPGAQNLLVRGDGDIFAAYGRVADMEAWLADTDYNRVSTNADGALVVEHVAASTEEGGEGDAAATTGRNPSGSDLWLNSFGDTDALNINEQLPEGVSVLIAYDGSRDAPDDIVLSWPLDNSTPLAGPLMVAGGIVLLIGLVLYVLAIRYQRRGRGPRRKGLGPLPVTEPIDLAALPADERKALDESAAPPASEEAETVDERKDVDQGKEPDSRTSMRAASPTRRRRWLALPALGVVAVLAAGCSADSWPQLGQTSASPSPSPTVITPGNQKPPAITEAQARRILTQVSSTVADADSALDVELARIRLDGAVLAARTTEYTLRGAIPETPPPAAIPTDQIDVMLPEATDRWPRTVLLLSSRADDETVPPVLLTMTQQDPWSNYKVTDMAEMSANAALPEVAAPWLGTSLVPADSAFLGIAPGRLAEAFADVVDAGDQSASYGLFDELSLNLATSIRDSRQAVVQNLADNNAAETSQAAFDMVPADAQPTSMTTLDSGAIVSVSLVDTETVTPTSADAVIRFGENNAQARALTGVSESARGVRTTYGFQLFFAVPAQGSTDKIRLLASHQDLLSVEVIE